MRSLRKLLVLMSMVVVLSMLSMGVAFAHDAPPGVTAPVGNNIAETGRTNGFLSDSNALAAIARNPLCPLHAATHSG